MIWFIFLCALPSLYEAYTDRHGETRNQKVSDVLILIGAACCLSLLAWLVLAVSVPKTIALLLGWRVLLFDYTVSYLLIKNDVIVGHWFTYTGKTARWDKLISKVNPRVRFAIRVALFGAALWWLLGSN